MAHESQCLILFVITHLRVLREQAVADHVLRRDKVIHLILRCLVVLQIYHRFLNHSLSLIWIEGHALLGIISTLGLPFKLILPIDLSHKSSAILSTIRMKYLLAWLIRSLTSHVFK